MISKPRARALRAIASRAVDPKQLTGSVRSFGPHAAPAVALVAIGALAKACAAGAPPPKTLEGLLEAVGASAHVVVKPTDFVWEGSDGAYDDYTVGRRMLFLGAVKPGAPRDLYRARIRLSPEGRPLEVADVVNLTANPTGDEQGLVRDASGEHAAFLTVAYGQVQNLTILDLRSAARATKATTRAERAMLWVTNLQETGDGAGITKIQVNIEAPTSAAMLRFDGPTLVAQFALVGGGTKLARINPDAADLSTQGDGLRVELVPQIPKKFIHWAVDTVRAIPWVGPEPIAWLESKVWEYKDRFKRWKYAAPGSTPATEVKTEAELVIASKALDASAAGVDGGYWPPASLSTLFKVPEPGEGVWEAVAFDWLHVIPGAPPTFYKTFIRPDPVRPYSKIMLVAMDTRQLDFDMEAGVEDPKPTVGSFHGTGRLPRDEVTAKRAVAAFNGGFKSEHGHYGMMLRKKVLLPPLPAGATAVVMDDGRFGMGTWSPTPAIPGDMTSYRQNMDPLIEDGITNPRKRGNWGAVLIGQPKLSGQQTERSGLCITKSRHMFYVWGDDVGHEAMAKAMQLAGCDYGMHLDMNPYHTGFVFLSFEDAQFKVGKSETLTPLMAIANRRYIDYNPKDFFYALLRNPKPKSETIAYSPDDGVQPPPMWLPALWKADDKGVALTLIEAGRVRFSIRAGTSEPEAKSLAVGQREITGEEGKRVIASFGLGTSDGKYGASFGGKSMRPMGPGHGALVLNDGNLSLVAESPASAADVVQGPWLIRDGKLREAPSGTTHMRLAIGMTKDGKIIVARAKVGSDESLGRSLLEAGCVSAIGSRGNVDSFVARAGGVAGAEAPMSSYPQTTLYVLADAMGPRAFRFDRSADGKPLWPIPARGVP